MTKANRTATTTAATLTRTWTSPISERIAGVSVTGRRVAIQENVRGNWYGYIGGKRVQMFFGYDNNEQGATAWLRAELAK